MDGVNILSISFLVLGFVFVAALLVETCRRSRERSLKTLQSKIRSTLMVLIVLLWVSYLTGTVLFLQFGVLQSLDTAWYYTLVNIIQSFSASFSLLFMSLATLERYSSFMSINKGQHCWTWFAICVFTVIELILAIVGAPMDCFSPAIWPDLFNAGGILGGIQGIMVILGDYGLNIAMIRVALSIKLTDANIDQHQAQQLFLFKRRMISIFVLLAVLDICDCVVEVVCNIGLVRLSSAAYNLAQVVTFPFYLPLHVLILYSLLDMFKRELLKPASGFTRAPVTELSIISSRLSEANIEQVAAAGQHRKDNYLESISMQPTGDSEFDF